MNRKIMIVDAHPVYAPKIAAFLEGLTFKDIEIVAKSSQVVSRVRAFMPDMVILSGMLPDADSVDILKKIKIESQSLPVIVQTGLLCDEKMCSAFENAGAVAVLPRLEKDLSHLQKAIEDVCKSIGSLR